MQTVQPIAPVTDAAALRDHISQMLEQTLSANALPAETDYLAVWQAHVAVASSHLDMAVLGGVLADRLAWVFMAGYQSAVRQTFAEQAFRVEGKPGWAALAVSEDRRGEPPLPGVTHAREQSASAAHTFLINGYKTWVAASASVAHIVIKSGRGTDAQYFNVHRNATGLVLSAKPAGFLSELSQGRAHFDQVRLPADAEVDASQVVYFGLREALYIYIAFVAYAQARYREVVSATQAAKVIADLVPFLYQPPADAAALRALKEGDIAVQAVLAQIDTQATAAHANWAKDRRLVTMYSKGIQARE